MFILSILHDDVARLTTYIRTYTSRANRVQKFELPRRAARLMNVRHIHPSMKITSPMS